MHDYSGEEEKPSDEQLRLLQTMAERLSAAEIEVEALEERLEAAKKVARSIRENDLPDLMQSLGLRELKTTSGLVLKLREEIRASFFAKQPERREPAFQWLKANDHDGLIKNTVSVQFGKGQEALADQVARLLAEYEKPLNVQRKRDINHQTMLAFLRERLREGEEVPLELFGAYVQKFVDVG